MCFGSGAPDYVKKDYGALPSLGTGSATKTVTLKSDAVDPSRGSSDDSSSTAGAAMARARASYNESRLKVRPVARGQSQKRSLVSRGLMAVRYPNGRG